VSFITNAARTRGVTARVLRTAIAAAAFVFAAEAAHAGRSCEDRPPQARAVAQGMALAQRTAERLDATGADVVALARAGQDLRRWGLRWSHFGYAYRDTSGATPVWRVVHKLNQCGTGSASLYRQGLAEFFLDDPWEYAAGVVVLAPDVQRHLLPLLRDNDVVARLDTRAYNMVAYPWATRYQQSNQWALEMLAMAEDPAATTRPRAQAWLQLKGYEPTALHIGALERLAAEVSRANIRFDDHPNAKRFGDRIETVTADSVFAWLQRSGLGGPVMPIR
jgi:hypothetical protein